MSEEDAATLNLQVARTECDQIGRFIALWATFQSQWQQLLWGFNKKTNYFAQIAHIVRHFL